MRFLVWSNVHGGWLRPQRNGYTRSLDEAGYFNREDAENSWVDLGGGDTTERTDPFTSRVYRQNNAVIMAAHEVLVAL